MDISPYRDQGDTWYALYREEARETRELRDELWALQNENAQLRASHQLTHILVVHLPAANDNDEARAMAVGRIYLNAGIIGATVMLILILMLG